MREDIHPEDNFRIGKGALRVGKPAYAAAHFHAALVEEERRAPLGQRMKYLSYYGLAMTLADKPRHKYAEMCEQSVRKDGFDADVLANLAHVYFLARRRSKALPVILRGLRIEPTHGRLNELLLKIERRKPPVFGSLSRDNFLNRTAGRIRRTLLSRSA